LQLAQGLPITVGATGIAKGNQILFPAGTVIACRICKLYEKAIKLAKTAGITL
jgi:hypothetical protein